MTEEYFKYLTKYEKARIVGARALQISMGAPILIEIDEKTLEEINYNPIKIAMMELESGKIPFIVVRKGKKYTLQQLLKGLE